MTYNPRRDYGIVILLDALGTSQRILDNIDKFIVDWDSVLNKLSQNICILDEELASRRYRTGIIIKDIFDNIQIFFPTDDPDKGHIDVTGSNSLWWTIQISADLLTNIVRYGITKDIFFRGCISMGHIRKYKNGYFSSALIENAKYTGSFEMIGVIAGDTTMRVLNNKSYSSSPRFYHFVKYRLPIKEPTRKSRKRFDKLAALNIMKKSDFFDDLRNEQIIDIIQEKIQRHQSNPTIRKKWENTQEFIQQVQSISDESRFL